MKQKASKKIFIIIMGYDMDFLFYGKKFFAHQNFDFILQTTYFLPFAAENMILLNKVKILMSKKFFSIK